jgi:hypothetical protein
MRLTISLTLMGDLMMKAKTKRILVIMSVNAIIWSLLLGYLAFFVMPGPNDMPTIIIKLLAIGATQLLYLWFMWAHRTEKGFSFRVWR